MPRPEVTRQQRDAHLIGNLIANNAKLYDADPCYKAMVDNTVFFTLNELHESQRIIGGTLRKGDYGQNN